jgi:hypothetical protein
VDSEYGCRECLERCFEWSGISGRCVKYQICERRRLPGIVNKPNNPTSCASLILEINVNGMYSSALKMIKIHQKLGVRKSAAGVVQASIEIVREHGI